MVLNVQFEIAGYQTTNVIRNIKSFFVYIVMLILLFVAYKISDKLASKYQM